MARGGPSVMGAFVTLSLVVGVMAALVDLVAAVVIALVLTLVVVTFASRRGSHVLMEVVIGAAVFAAPLNGVRVGGVVTMTDLLLVVGAVIVLVVRSLRQVDTAWEYYRPFLLSPLLISVGALVGALFAGAGWAGMVDLVRFALSTIGVLAVFHMWAPGTATLRRLLWAFLLGSALSAGLGSFGLEDAAGRAIGLAAHSNHLAVASLLGCGAGVGLTITGERWSSRVAGGLSAVLAFGMVASGSRAAIAGMAVFGISFLIYAKRWRLLVWSGSIVAIAAASVLFGAVKPTSTDALGRLIGKDPTAALSDDARRDASAIALRTIEQHPLTGVGFVAAKDAHNIYLQLWAASGILGLAGAAVLLFGAGRLLKSHPSRDFLSGALACSYLGYLVAAAFSTVLWDRYLWLHIALTVALCSVRQGRPREEGNVSGDGRQLVRPLVSGRR